MDWSNGWSCAGTQPGQVFSLVILASYRAVMHSKFLLNQPFIFHVHCNIAHMHVPQLVLKSGSLALDSSY